MEENHRRIGEADDSPRPKHKYNRGDLVTVRGMESNRVIWGRHGIVRRNLGPWSCEYTLCPLCKDQKLPDMRSWNADWGAGRKRVNESEILLVKSGWYVDK